MTSGREENYCPTENSETIFNMNTHRRPSAVGESLLKQKLDDACKMSLENRLRVALELADITFFLRRACLAKH